MSPAFDDAEWMLRCLRGDLQTDDALHVVAIARATPNLSDQLARALADGDAAHPDDPRRFEVVEIGAPAVDEDPATVAVWGERHTDVEQWDDPDASGAQLLDEVVAQLTRFVAFPSLETADAVALFVAATHAQTAWEHATRLVIKSPVKRCGKTRLQEVLSELAHNVLKTTNISPAALVRSIGLDDPPTIVLDEADSVFATRRGERSEGAEDLRGLLNSGHSRGWPYVRWDATARRAESCPTFAMAVLGGIGDMPDTIEDRAVIVTMRRRAPGEHVDQYRRRRVVGRLRSLRDRLGDWIRDNLDVLAEAEPELPVEDRAADVWEPLVAVADLAGGDWPARARTACKALAGSAVDDTADGNRLLADLWTVFGTADRLLTATILDRLNNDETTPWGGWHRGDGLNPRDLARLLRPYSVRPRSVRTADGRAKGYAADDLADPWSRYVPGFHVQTRDNRDMGDIPGRDVTGVTGVTDERLPLDLDQTATDSEDR